MIALKTVFDPTRADHDYTVIELHIEDQAAKQFYGAVSGWEPEPFGPDVTLFRLPGYVGGEPLQPVPRDVVAGLTAGEPGWGVEVWVADADEAAAKTAELGGTVHVEPHETPGFRTSVITDPEGATLSVNQLVVAHAE